MTEATRPLRKTPLFNWHKAHGARLLPFAGYEMPIQYKGVIPEHEAVRQRAGLFDVSHMGVARVSGSRARAFLEGALTRKLSDLQPGQARYSLLCREDGGTVDDLIVYCFRDDEFWLVLNASNKEKDLAYLGALPGSHEVRLEALFEDLSLFALQGPQAPVILEKLGLKNAAQVAPFSFIEAELGGIHVQVAFTGYTGEAGCEIFVAADRSLELWTKILAVGAPLGLEACGLAARDTLRLEMGYSLYGHELLDSINPVEAGLSWAVDWDKTFVGSAALAKARTTATRKLVALKNTSRQAPRADMRVFDAAGRDCGYVTSGSFAPSLGHAIALALVEKSSEAPYSIEIRNQKVPFESTRRPFYRRDPAAVPLKTAR